MWPRIVSCLPIDVIPMSLRHDLSIIGSALPEISASKNHRLILILMNLISFRHSRSQLNSKKIAKFKLMFVHHEKALISPRILVEPLEAMRQLAQDSTRIL